jgi:hypothetical protein
MAVKAGVLADEAGLPAGQAGAELENNDKDDDMLGGDKGEAVQALDNNSTDNDDTGKTLISDDKGTTIGKLDKMALSKLLTYAKEHEIDLTGVDTTKKAVVLDVIKEAPASAASPTGELEAVIL